MFRMLTDNDVDQLANAVCTVLEKVGLHTENQEILRALEGAGARVDSKAGVARFPGKPISSASG